MHVVSYPFISLSRPTFCFLTFYMAYIGNISFRRTRSHRKQVISTTQTLYLTYLFKQCDLCK